MLRYFSKGSRLSKQIKPINLYGKYIYLSNKEAILNQIKEETSVFSSSSLEENQFYIAIIIQQIQENGYASNLSKLLSDHLINILNNSLLSQDLVSLRLLLEVGKGERAKEYINQNLFSPVSQDTIRIWPSYINYIINQNKNDVAQHQSLKDQNTEIAQFIGNTLSARIKSLSMQEFSEILTCILALFKSNTHIKEEIMKMTKLSVKIQDKLNDFERLPELIEIDEISGLFLNIAEIKRECNHHLDQLNMDMTFYNSYLLSYFPQLSPTQILNLCSLFLSPHSNSQYQYSSFVEKFYFTFIKSYPFHLREYTQRKLGIDKYKELSFISLVKTVATRLTLMSTVSKSPPYFKYLQFSPVEKLRLTQILMESQQYNNSPLIPELLRETADYLAELYSYEVQLDFHKESNLKLLFQQLILTLSKAPSKLLKDDTSCIHLIQLVSNFFCLYKNLLSSESFLNLFVLAQKTDVMVKKDKKDGIFQILIIKSLLNYFQTVSEVEVVNINYDWISLLSLFQQIDILTLDNSMNFLELAAQNIDKVILSSRLTFINFLLNEYSTNKKSIANLFEIVHSKAQLKELSETFELKAKIIILSLNCNVDSKIIINSIQSLVESSKERDLNEQNILLSVKIILGTQQQPQNEIKAKEIDQFQDVMFRIISDNASHFSIDGYQQIISICLQMNNVNKNFDDGSGCYPDTLFDELAEFNSKSFNKFTSEFQDKIKPFMKKEESIAEKYYETFKENVIDITGSSQHSK